MARRFAKLVFLLPLIIFPASAAIAADPAAEQLPPNIVVILVDDLRWDELGCSGHRFARTPHIDRIAYEGARFRNAFCTAPLCSPSRACILTGLHVHYHGIRDNTDHSRASHKLKTFPRDLRQAGYQTAFIGKWHMGNDDTARPGFNHWVGMKGQGTSFDPVLNVDGERIAFTGHVTDVLNDKAVEFINKQGAKPFCLYLSHKALHPELKQRDDGSITDPEAARFLPAKRHEDLYKNAAIPRRLNVTDDASDKPALNRTIQGLPPLSRQTGTSDQTIRDRQRMLVGIDEGVGLIFEALEASGKLDETVIVFTSDHGYWYGEHGLSVERRLPYEEGIRIPLLIRYPPLIASGILIDEFALSIDLAPTLLSLAGTSSDHEFDGRDLTPLLRGEHPEDWRTSFLIEYNSDTVFPRVKRMGYRAIRTDAWKYIRYNDLEGMDELYNLLADPYEMENVIDDPDSQEILKQLQAELDGMLPPAGRRDAPAE